MQTPTTRRAPAVAMLQYPDPDQLPKHMFWIAMYFRDVAQLQALKDLTEEMHRRRRQADPMFHALYGAQDEFRKTIKMSLGYAISKGMLLFAFDQTTVFSAADGMAA